jgi:hypothetical protein
MLYLPMITFIIGLSGNEENVVSLHHLFVCMTSLTNLCVEFLPELHRFWFIPL